MTVSRAPFLSNRPDIHPCSWQAARRVASEASEVRASRRREGSLAGPLADSPRSSRMTSHSPNWGGGREGGGGRGGGEGLVGGGWGGGEGAEDGRGREASRQGLEEQDEYHDLQVVNLQTRPLE